MIFYITNAALDISAAICWWILKTTGYLVYGGITYILPSSNDKEEEYNLEDSIIVLDKEELYDRLLRPSQSIIEKDNVE